MTGAQQRVLWGAIVAVLVFVLIGVFIGWTEAILVTFLMGLLTATAWMPARVARIVGSLYLAFVVGIFGRVAWGFVGGLIFGLAVGLIAWRFLPTRVQRRVAFMIPSMVLLIFVTCTLMYMAPGSPFAQERVTTQQALEAQQARFKIEATATAFFFSYMHGIVQEGTMGQAVKVQGRTVEELLFDALPVSMSLGVLALTIAVALGLFLGVRAGLKPNSVADYSSMGLAMIGISLPNFVIGAGFMILFALSWGWLPVAGWGTYGHLLMPALTLALPYAAYIARLARGGTIEVMQQDFIRTARAKGLSERAVVLKHALKGSILPVVSFLGPAAAGIFTGSFVIETMFGIPGMGQFFVKSAIGRDYSVVLGTAIIYFTIITMFNLLVDIAYAWLDPRVREEL